MKNLRKGRIVVVKEGLAFGNFPGIITKIAAPFGELPDSMSEDYGLSKRKTLVKNVILCEDVRHSFSILTYLNKPVVFEKISDLRYATEEEKKYYRKHRKEKN